jgi:hypothetical protein
MNPLISYAGTSCALVCTFNADIFVGFQVELEQNLSNGRHMQSINRVPQYWNRRTKEGNSETRPTVQVQTENIGL